MYALIVLAFWFLPQAPPATPAPVEERYRPISISEPEVRSAFKAALSAGRLKGKLVSAERPAVSATNMRLCISTNRSGSYEFARVDLSRNPSGKKWEVIVWSWGSCGR
jgi:hypothetical protein